MTVLVLSPYPERLAEALKDEERSDNPDWVISFGHREILKPDFLARHKCINIHIGYLPYNRGADPNFWSWFDNTPKGVTIHQMTRGIDTGPFYARRPVIFRDGHTLRTSHETLMRSAVNLFTLEWPSIRDGSAALFRQSPPSTYHRSADKDRWMKHLPLGWDTPCSVVKSLGEEYRSHTAA